MMSHIAHAQLPWLPGMARSRTDEKEGGTKLPVAVPLAAAMAICALHLELRYKEKSDGLVTRKDSEVPGSIVVKPEKKLDHAWMVYAPSRHEPNEPDAAQMCEALIAVLLHHHHRWKRPLPGPPPQADETIFSDPNEFLTTDAARSFLADSEEEQPCTTSSDRVGTSSDVIEGVESMRQIADMVVLDAITRAMQDEMAPAMRVQSKERNTTADKVVDDTTKGTQPSTEGSTQ